MFRSPAYAAMCLATLALLIPGPSTGGPHWPRSADFWATAAVVNITIDDTSSLVTYSNNTTWRPSTEACATCLAPAANLAYAATWHDGTHILPTLDNDDFSAASTSQAPPSATSQPAGGGDTDEDDEKDDDDDDKKGGDSDSKGDGDSDSSGKGKGKGKGSRRKRRLQGATGSARLRRQDAAVSNPFFVPNLDSDDPGFVDKPVTMQFNFTGSAIYLFAIVPEYAAPANTTPTFMNLTYTLDSQPAGTFQHTGNASTPISTFSPSVVVFHKTGLQASPHSLTVSVGPDSVFLFDYIVYTADTDFEQSGNTTSGSPAVPANATIPDGTTRTSPSPSVVQTTTSDLRKSSHSVATFAGAIGGSVGLLTVLAISLAFSIYRRRLRARRRDRAYREARGAASISSFHTDASEDGPPMRGPQPFVPRYFPGTVITAAAPPPYSPPASPSNDQTSALLGPPETPIPSVSWSSRRTAGGVISDSDSWADRAPPTPSHNGSLEGFDDEGYFSAPPSFPIAIATPVPAILAGLSGVSSPSPAPAGTSPSSRPTTPASPVIPLLPPPPSSRPASLHSTHEQTAGAGPSDTPSPLTLTPLAQPVASSRVSVRSLYAHTSEESAVGADCETNSISRLSFDSNQAGGLAPVLISPISSLMDSQGGTGAQGQEHRSEGAEDHSAL